MNRKLKDLLHNILYICVIAVLMAWSVTNSKCQANELILHLTSRHDLTNYRDLDTGEIKTANTNNLGLGYSYTLNNFIDVRGGFYKNTYNKTSIYAGAFLNYNLSNYFTAGILAGAVTGYEGHAVPFIVLPTVQAKYKKALLEVGYFPAIKSTLPSLITFSIGYII